MAAKDVVILDEQERLVLCGMLRREMVRVAKGLPRGKARFGEDFDDRRLRSRIGMLTNMYERLGGDMVLLRRSEKIIEESA